MGKPSNNQDTKRMGSYTIGQLAELANISSRTLRHYEDKGLLAPMRTESGYRTYTQSDAKRLAQILAMKACGLTLAAIGSLLSGTMDVKDALTSHLATLQAQGASVNQAIKRTKAAIAALERMDGMDASDAFEDMKRQGLEGFEQAYGQEARKLYGNDAIEEANARMMALTKDEWDAKELLEEAIKVQLRIAMATEDPTSEASQELAHMHEKWIRIHWGEGYTREAHRGLAQGYLEDSRFRAYYDEPCGEGATDFLVEALLANLR